MKKSLNKSTLIREIIARNPDLTAPEILAQLSKNGTPVSAPLVYQVLRKMGAPNESKRGRKPGSTVTKVVSANAYVGTNDLFAAMQNFVQAAGSLDKAIEILSVFKK